ncbi:discoidin domain-containing protein [Paenibacillus sp. MBLB2552]|uniref:Discoidin domain-containing protein n=1 Tax=Paenibacillus mellifer TaxID=2937794 RepID=A0A9X2BPF8_9BACL|nr:discoidin domain-containing protein [Paenibacillus mellifer]MCK8487128.1 discoidin domain-containing protein [Paenibacillus mellifer]
MPKLPSGLTTFEPSDTVRRTAQNENIEAIDALFRATGGHRHTGKAGDAPQIGTEGIAVGAVTSDRIALSAVTGDRVARATLCRRHLKSGRLSGNVAKYKPFTVTGGVVVGVPTAPYRQYGDNYWLVNRSSVPFPQSITVNLTTEYYEIEGISFENNWVAPPRNFYVEISSDNTNWTRAYTYSHSGTEQPPQYHPFDQLFHGSYVRLTLTEPGNQTNIAYVSGFGVFSRDVQESPDFRIHKGSLQYSEGWGWKDVGIKGVQRGSASISYFYPNGTGSTVREVTISAVNPQKTFVNITTSGLSHWFQTSPMMDGSVCARLVDGNKLRFNFYEGFYEAYAEISWEVIEFA